MKQLWSSLRLLWLALLVCGICAGGVALAQQQGNGYSGSTPYVADAGQILGCTEATVVSGQTYTLLPTDCIIRFDTTGDAGTATADMVAPSYVGQRITFYWWAWSASQVAPTINVNAGAKLVPFSGQATSGAAGLVTSTTISTPGASLTEVWDSVEWTTW